MNTKQLMMASAMMAVVASSTACTGKTAYNDTNANNLKTSVSTTKYGTNTNNYTYDGKYNMNTNDYVYDNQYGTNMNSNKYAKKTNVKTNGNQYTARNGYTYNVDGTKYTNRDFYADGLIDNNTYTYNDKYNNAYRSNYDGGYTRNETMTEQIVDNVAQMGENVKDAMYGTDNLKTGVYNANRTVNNNVANDVNKMADNTYNATKKVENSVANGLNKLETGVYNTTKAVENNVANGKIENNTTPYLSYDNNKLGMNVSNGYNGTYSTSAGYNGMESTYVTPNNTTINSGTNIMR